VDDDGLPSTPDEWRRFFAKLRLAARRVMRRRNVFELIQQGAPMIGITQEDLVQHAVQCLLENEPPFCIAVESLWTYCVTRIDYRVRAACAREENRPRLTRFFAVSPTDAEDEDDELSRTNVVPISEYGAPDEIFESADTVRRFIEYLRNAKPHLTQLFHLQMVYDTDPSQECKRLGMPIDRIYRLRKELAAAKKRFRACAKKTGG